LETISIVKRVPQLAVLDALNRGSRGGQRKLERRQAPPTGRR